MSDIAYSTRRFSFAAAHRYWVDAWSAAENEQFFKPSEETAGHAMFDLGGYITRRVERAGIADFEDLGLCTFAEPERFFSYRRATKLGEPDYGRHINAIAIAD